MTARTLTHRFDDRTARLSARLQSRITVRAAAAAADPEAGMTTAEYAVGTVAACGFGGVLYKVLTSQELLKMIKDLVMSTIKHYFSW